MRIPFATNSYQARSLPLSAQRLVNLYLEAAPPDAKSPLVLYGTPGLTLFSTCGAGPIRSIHDFDGTLAVVSGQNLYTISSGGTATDRGSVGANGDVFMSDNGSQLGIVTGTGTTDFWIWNGATLAQIADADFPGASNIGFVDGYTIVTKPASNRFYISSLNDMTAWDALDYASAEGQPDNLVGCFVDHREVWLFGERTTEVWYNSGSGTPPFDRISGAYAERGCIAIGSVAKADNSVFWLGDDKIVYRAAGYTPQRVSTHAIEYAIAGYASPQTARAWTYSQEGHTFYVLTFDEATWVFDAATQRWHQRDSRDSQGYDIGRWRADCGTRCYNKEFVGDYVNGNIYELDLDVYTENTIGIKRIATSAPIHGEGRFVSMPRLEIEVESGAGLTTGQGSDPQAMLRFSDDGGRTWSNELWRSMGEIGEYHRRAVWNRLGRFRERILEVTISDPIKVAIIAANADVQ